MAEVQAVDPKAPDTTTEDELDESLAESLTEQPKDDESKDDPDAEGGFKFDPEKFQKQNREVGNLKRELAELKELVKKRDEAKPPPPAAKAEPEHDETDELADDLAELQRNGFADEERAKKVFGRLGAQLKKAKKSSELEQVRQELETLRGELRATTTIHQQSAIFNENFPELDGQYARFNAKALRLAREDLGEDADPQQLVGAATSLLQRMAKIAVRQAKAKPGASGTTDKDKTAMSKPAQSTKGTASAKRGGVPQTDLTELSDDDLRRIVAQGLEEAG